MGSGNTRRRQFPAKMSTTAFVKMYILHLLDESTYYGNQIIDEIEARLNGRWAPSPGMVYPLLNQLETDGFIEGWWEEPNKRSIKRYRITKEGSQHYKTLLLKNKQSIEDSLVMLKSILKDLYGEDA